MDTSGNKVKWLKIKWIKVTYDSSFLIQFKNDFDDEDFRQIETKGKAVSRRSGISIKTIADLDPEKLYVSQLAISAAKKNDMLNLCRTGVIPAEYHHYYQSLKTSATVTDRLPEPDQSEDICDSDTDI